MSHVRTRPCLLLCMLLVWVAPGKAQTAPVNGPAQAAVLEKKLDQLLEALDGMRQQVAESERKIDALSAEVRQVRTEIAADATQNSAREAHSSSAEWNDAAGQIKEQVEINQAEIKQQAQTKVESISKYPVKVSGLLLFSSFLNDGTVDEVDNPTLPLPRNMYASHGSFAATMRQSILGLEGSGPQLWGGRSSADLRVDFFGGVPASSYWANAGILRLRTAHANLRWEHNVATAALDAPLISPLQPTSLLSQGTPLLAGSGNLWNWSPQLEFLHRHRWGTGTAGFELGLIDAATPTAGANTAPAAGQTGRHPSPGESSRQPGYEGRVSYSFGGENPYSFGAGGYYDRQRYAYGQRVDAWAGTLDWKAPLSQRFELSGEFYRGRAIAGLGGGAYKDYVLNTESGRIQGLDSEGGWAQLKAKLSRSLEANAAIGVDDAFADELGYAAPPETPSYYSDLARSRTGTANVIFRPKAYLVFSAEYRNLHSWPVHGASQSAQSLGLGAGYIF